MYSADVVCNVVSIVLGTRYNPSGTDAERMVLPAALYLLGHGGKPVPYRVSLPAPSTDAIIHRFSSKAASPASIMAIQVRPVLKTGVCMTL
eukprot:34138-Rhodomonas_salina.3